MSHPYDNPFWWYDHKRGWNWTDEHTEVQPSYTSCLELVKNFTVLGGGGNLIYVMKLCNLTSDPNECVIFFSKTGLGNLFLCTCC